MSKIFEVEKALLDQAQNCPFGFKCLTDDLPQCAEVPRGVESVLCHNDLSAPCHHQVQITPHNLVCICPIKLAIVSESQSHVRDQKNEPPKI